jgi:hypothetical protein
LTSFRARRNCSPYRTWPLRRTSAPSWCNPANPAQKPPAPRKCASGTMPPYAGWPVSR